MNDEQNNPSAQGPTQQDAENSNPFAGIQQRIDQLTAKYHDSERSWSDRYNQLADENRELLRQMAMRNAPVQAEQAPEIDPEDRTKFDYLIRQAQAPLQQHIANLEGMVFGGQAQQRAAALGVTDPNIINEANKLIADWTRRGYLKQGVTTIDDAFRLAAGNAALAQNNNQQQRQQFNQLGTGIPVPGAGMGQRQPQQPQQRQWSMDDLERDPASAVAALEQSLYGKEF